MDITLSLRPLSLTLRSESSGDLVVLDQPPVELSLGVPGLSGPPGPTGPGGGVVSYLQDNEPVIAAAGATLFKPTTQQFMVYDGNWKPINMDGGHF